MLTENYWTRKTIQIWTHKLPLLKNISSEQTSEIKMEIETGEKCRSEKTSKIIEIR